jgi:hypothetical protein
VNNNLRDGKNLEISLSTFEVYAPEFLTYVLKKKTYEGEAINSKIVKIPKRFKPDGESKETIGFSDHFPILVKLEYPEEKKPKKRIK